MSEENEDVVIFKDDLKEYLKYYDLLIDKCNKNNISYSTQDFIEEKLLIIELPNGRNKRSFNVWSTISAKEILKIPFEKYTFIGDYESFCNYESGYLESIIEPLDRYPLHYLYRKLFGKEYSDDDQNEEELKILLKDTSHPEVNIEISSISENLLYFSHFRGRARKILSIKIWSPKIKQHDIALSLLEKISNSLFFQIDTIEGIPLTLSKSKRTHIKLLGQRKTVTIPELKFPKNEYSEAPIALYWYARSAVRMPLLQFLAFYQSIEYFFPVYSQAEAKRRVKNILKDDSFRTDRDSDIVRILTAIKSNYANSYGDEKSQLLATLLECIDPDELRNYFTEKEYRKEFFMKTTKGITKHKIPINNESLDLRNDVAERIYDIRCKIVHTKSDGKETDIEMLLPFSKEADLLYDDIELIQFISKKVLIASSIPLKI